MDRKGRIGAFLSGKPGIWLPVLGGICILAVALWLRGLSVSLNLPFFEHLQFTSGIVALTFAGAALVRFRGTGDRLPLILAVGFVIVGAILSTFSLASSSVSPAETDASLRDPLTWVAGRTLLAILLVSALFVERRHPWSRNPARDISAGLIIVVFLTALLSLAHHHLPLNLVVHPGSFFPRPGNLVPALFFLVAALGYHRRLKSAISPFDFSLYLAAALNLWCSLAAAQSDRRLDANFALASTLQFASYVLLLGGAFLDNVRLFQSIQSLAVTDPVTGLANYRRLIESIELEIERADRTRKPFAFLLFDLDGLKTINDQFGHPVGTQALRRVADVLRLHSRAIDTAARHGGDEFALLLPETSEEGAREVANRVCERAASDGLQPPISLSAGIALFPQDARTVEALMEAADRALYHMKEAHKPGALYRKRTAV